MKATNKEKCLLEKVEKVQEHKIQQLTHPNKWAKHVVNLTKPFMIYSLSISKQEHGNRFECNGILYEYNKLAKEILWDTM